MALGSGAAIGEAYIRIRPTATGFEAEVIAEIGPAIKASEKALPAIKPKVDPSGATGPLDVIKSKLNAFAGKNPLTSTLKDVETASGGAEGALGGLATGGIAIAAAAITAFAIKGVVDFQALAGEVRNFQRVTGATAESSSQFVASFRAIGTDVAGATQALGRFGKNLETNSSGLTAMGVQIARTKTGATDITQTFLNVADAIHNSSDAGARNTLVLQAFGRSGLALLPILSRGRAGIEDLFGEAAKRHELLTQDDLDKAKDLSLATRQLKEEFTGLEREAGQALIPFLTQVAHAATATLGFIDDVAGLVSKVTSLGGLDKPVGEKLFGKKEDVDSLGNTVRDFFNVVVHGTKYADEQRAALEGAAGAAGDLGAASAMTEEDQIALAQAAQDVSGSLTAQAAAITTLTSAAFDETAAQQALATANRQVTTASDNLTAAHARLSALQAKGAVDAKAVAAAQKELEAATRSVVEAQQAAADATTARSDAEQALAALLSGETAAANAAKHTDDLGKAQLTLGKAQKSLGDAQDKLSTLQASGTATARELSDAQDDVTGATFDLHDAQTNLSDTQDTLNTLMHVGAENSAETVTARQTLAEKTATLTTAQQALTDAVAAEADARVRVTEANIGDVTFTDQVVNARKAIQTAEEGLAGATATASEKAKDLFDKQTALNGAMHGGLTDLQQVKSNLEAIVALQPQAAAFIGPTLDQINSLIAAAVQILGAATNINLKTVNGGQGFDRGKGQQAFGATGGFFADSFIAGERGPERVELLAGGGAMVTPAHRTGIGGGVTITAPLIHVEATFGPGSNAADLERVIANVATGVMAETLQRVIAKAGAR